MKHNRLWTGLSSVFSLNIECDKYLLASYDYILAQGYILSEGDYYISIGDNAHDALNNVLAAKGFEGMADVSGDQTLGDNTKAYKWTEAFDDVKYNNSQYTGEEVTNQFNDCDTNYWFRKKLFSYCKGNN